MEIIERQTDGRAVLELSGALRGAACRALDRRIGRLLAAGVKAISLDLGRLEGIDAEGVGAVARQFVRVVINDGALTLRHTPPRVRQMLVVTGLAGVMDALAEREPWTNPGRCGGADGR